MSKEDVEYTSMKHGDISRETHGRFQAGRLDAVSARLNSLPMAVQGWVSIDKLQNDPGMLPDVKRRLGIAKADTFQKMTDEERTELRGFQRFKLEEELKERGVVKRNETPY